MKYLSILALVALTVLFCGCELLVNPVKETSDGYQIDKKTELSVILQTPLSSNTNKRGDQFITTLKKPLTFKEKIVLSKDAQVQGLVKSVTKYEKFGDRASLLLLFDQIALPDGRKIPLVASLDTDEGERVIKIGGKAVKDASIVTGGAAAGALLGRASQDEEGFKKGLIIGAATGAGAVILSRRKEIKLPQGTELIIKLDEVFTISK